MWETFYLNFSTTLQFTQQVTSAVLWERPTVPSSSSLISPVHRAFVCVWTFLVTDILSLAIVAVRPGARNWLAKAFSVGEDWSRAGGTGSQKTQRHKKTQVCRVKSRKNWPASLLLEFLSENWLFWCIQPGPLVLVCWKNTQPLTDKTLCY